MIEASRQMSIDVLFNEQRVVSEAVELCKWFVFQEDVYNIMKDYMSSMCLRNDVFDIMMWQLACGAFDTLKGEGDTPEGTPVRTSMMNVWKVFLDRPDIADALKHQFLFFPVVDTLTLGLYSLVAPCSEKFEVAVEEFDEMKNKNERTQTK